MKLTHSKLFAGFSLLATLVASTSYAEIVLHGTRVIYPSDAREVTLQMSNNSKKPSLVQAWIDEGDLDSSPDQAKVPFMITPPISRVEGEKSQTMRITAMPGTNQYPQDRETLLWLNVIDIPPKPKNTADEVAPENFLQLAIRSRVKFFYRPKSIQADIREAATKIQWQIKGNQLVINNSTPFYFTISSIQQKNAGKTEELISETMMMSPYSEKAITIRHQNTSEYSFTYFNDYGSKVDKAIQF